MDKNYAWWNWKNRLEDWEIEEVEHKIAIINDEEEIDYQEIYDILANYYRTRNEFDAWDLIRHLSF